VLSSHLAASTPPGTIGPFVSLLEASLHARDEFSDVLVLLPEALKSAEESPYRYPDRAFEALQALAAAGRAWRDGELPRGGFGAFFSARAQVYASGNSQRPACESTGTSTRSSIASWWVILVDT
jgi:hypothetical protein